MKRDVSLFLSDMLEGMDDALKYVSGMSYESFVNDSKTRRAVVQCIENIGEAAKRIPDDVRTLKPELPWRDMARMRDKCIHVYFGINYEIVWTTVMKNLPAARPLIAELLEKVRERNKEQK